MCCACGVFLNQRRRFGGCGRSQDPTADAQDDGRGAEPCGGGGGESTPISFYNTFLPTASGLSSLAKWRLIDIPLSPLPQHRRRIVSRIVLGLVLLPSLPGGTSLPSQNRLFVKIRRRFSCTVGSFLVFKSPDLTTDQTSKDLKRAMKP